MFRVAFRQKEKKNPQCQAKVRKNDGKVRKNNLGTKMDMDWRESTQIVAGELEKF